jgi:sporulation protein YlmC with PRC-barrel domain
MNQKLKMICTTTMSLLTLGVLAEDQVTPGNGLLRSPLGQLSQPRIDRLNAAAKTSDVIGMTVKNDQEEMVGKVEDLALDIESGRIVQVIVSVGGLLGVGERTVAVPPGSLRLDVANNALHLDVTNERLKRAPEFQTTKWVEFSDAVHLASVYSYYGQEPALNFIDKANYTDVDNATATRDANSVGNKDRLATDHQWAIPISRLGQIQKASKLVGLNVKNLQEEKLGKVDNLLVDVHSGRIVAVVVSSGGFLGMGDELSAVPPAALHFNLEHDALQLDTTKDTFAAAPHFKSSQWPDFNQTTYSDSVYRAYKVEPYFTLTTNAPGNSDVTPPAKGVITFTPRVQGTNDADSGITARIRKAISSSQELSATGRNIKVVTLQGIVTLSGPVEGAEEKRQIGDIANSIAQVENVDNQLEVK